MSANSLKRFFSILGLLAALSIELSAGAAFPYPQNRSYAYGFKPVPFGASAAADATTILNKYNSWIAQKRVTAGGCGTPCYRIQGEDLGGDTVSEGISYGMYLAVYFNDQTTFNGLWNYKVSKNDGLGLMHWRVRPDGSIAGYNSATDADFDIAYSMYLAHYQWGSAGTFNYKSLADAEMTKIVAYDLDSNRVKPGDAFNDCRYPSYFFPNQFRVFGKEKPGDLATWNAVRNNSYNTIAAARNNTTGLLAEQCTDTGQGGGCFVSSTQYQYNSARIPFRMAVDYVYYGDANAGAQLQRMSNFFGGMAPGSVVDCYNLNGTTCGGNSHGAFVGPAGTAFMYNGSARLQEYYNYLMVTDYSNNYFGGAISLMSLLLLSGNMPNIADQGAMFTPTRTPANTPYAGTPTMTPTQTPVAFAYVFEDFENAILVNTYNYTGPAQPMSLTSGISNLQNNTGGGAFSDRIQVSKPTNGQYAGHGFDSSYAPASGVMNFTGATSVRIAIRTDTAMSFNISFREGNGVNGGDDEVWTSTTLAVAASGAWQVLNFPISGFTENIYNTCNPNCLTTGNNTFNLGSIKAFEIAFPSIIAATANVYIDDIAFIPGVLPTMTFTKTPFPNPFNQIYDDFEAGLSLSSGAPSRVTSYANTALGASGAWALDSTTYVAGARAGRFNYNLGTAPTSYGAGGSFLSPYTVGSFSSPFPGIAGQYYDASGAVQLQLWMFAPAGLKYRLTFQEAGTPAAPVNGADGEGWYTGLLTGTGTWTRVTVDIGDFVEDPYNTICNPSSVPAPGPCLSGGQAGNGLPNMNAIWQVGIKLPGEQVGVASRSGTVYLDDITFITSYKSPTRSPTYTPGAGSFTSTRSPTLTGTRTATRTATPSPSSTLTGTPSVSPTGSASSTLTPTGTFTAGSTRTATPTVTRTATPSATPSASPTPTGSSTSTRTATPSTTRTDSPTSTRTATPSATRTDSPTGTRTATPSASPTVTLSPTEVPLGSSPTATPTISPTFSVTRTSTLSASPSRTYSASATPSLTSTRSATPTSSVTVTPSFTSTLGADSPTLTATATPSSTPPVTVTNTPQGTLTYTPTATPPATPADTATATPADTATATPADSATATPADTATATPADTATATPADSATATPADTATMTRSPTPTATATCPCLPETATPTASPSGSATRTVTSTASPTMIVPSATATRVVPFINSVSPSSGSHAGGFTLTVNGTNFAAGAEILFDGTALATSSGGPGILTAVAPAHVAGTVLIQVRNPDGMLSQANGSVVIAGPAPTATPLPEDGLPIIAVQPFPNPNPIELRVQLGMKADSVEVKVYTRAMVLVGIAQTQGPLAVGWNRIALPDLGSNGAYFFTVSASRNQGVYTWPGGGKFVIIHN